MVTELDMLIAPSSSFKDDEGRNCLKFLFGSKRLQQDEPQNITDESYEKTPPYVKQISQVDGIGKNLALICDRDRNDFQYFICRNKDNQRVIDLFNYSD